MDCALASDLSERLDLSGQRSHQAPLLRALQRRLGRADQPRSRSPRSGGHTPHVEIEVGDEPQVMVTDDDRAQARDDVRRTSRGTTVGGIGFVVIATFGGGAIAEGLFPNVSGIVHALVSAAIAATLSIPLVFTLAGTAKRRAVESGSAQAAQDRAMREDADRREFETRLARGLEMSDDEIDAFDVIGRAMNGASPKRPVEMLLADNSHAHLERVVVSSPDGTPPGCSVDSPDRCVAARRAQTQVFEDSEELDACPMLRGRPQGRCSGVCVPVSIMGRTVGVIHTTGEVDDTPSGTAIAALQTLANQAGNRLGMLRVMAETEMQATTDGLTGLVNRRSFENRLRKLRTEGREFAVVMADLDRFKGLNDTHGHETGDRALRIFAETLRRELRDDDLACRYGGEEFAIVLPDADLHDAVHTMQRVRELLGDLTERGDAPRFTASFGIAHSTDADDNADLVQRADAALFAAKDAGRDRICIDGHAMPVAPTTLTALA
jgi:diguanylate cyclase (GGDEF)-like protein